MTSHSQAKHLFKGTFTFTLGAFLRKGVNFLLLPLYTSALAASGYGALAMLTVLGGLITTSLNFGLGSALTVQAKSLKENKTEGVAIHSIITFLLFVSASVYIILFFAAPLYAHIFVKESNSVFLLRLYLISAIVNILIEMFYVFLRIHFQYTKQLVVSLVDFVMSTTLIILFVLVFKWGLRGVVLGMVIPSSLTLIYFLLTSNYKPQFDKTVFQPLLKFGIWLVLGNLGALIYTFADRFFIQEYFSSSEVGVYSLAVKLSSMLTVFFLTPFRQSFGSYIFQQENSLDAGINIGFKFLLIVSGLGFLGIALAAQPLVDIMATPEFKLAATVVPILVVVEICNAFLQIFAIGIHKAGKSYIDSAIVWGASLVNIGLNFLLIPSAGILGAALATLVTYMLMLLAYYSFSAREIYIGYPWRFSIIMLLLIFVIYFIAKMGLGLSPVFLIQLLIYSSAILAFLSISFACLEKPERDKVISMATRRIFRLKLNAIS